MKNYILHTEHTSNKSGSTRTRAEKNFVLLLNNIEINTVSQIGIFTERMNNWPLFVFNRIAAEN